jgi:hypothetical protein
LNDKLSVIIITRPESGNAVNTIENQFHGLGSNTIAAVSSEGVVNASFAYAPYGEVIESTQKTECHPSGIRDSDKADAASMTSRPYEHNRSSAGCASPRPLPSLARVLPAPQMQLQVVGQRPEWVPTQK